MFVLPTREDIWGLLINEALSYELSVIITGKCVAKVELIEQNINGHIVSADDSSALPERCDKLLSCQPIDNYRRNALDKIKW